MGFPSAINSERPRPTLSIPSVAMKAGITVRAIRQPLTPPSNSSLGRHPHQGCDQLPDRQRCGATNPSGLAPLACQALQQELTGGESSTKLGGRVV